MFVCISFSFLFVFSFSLFFTQNSRKEEYLHEIVNVVSEKTEINESQFVSELFLSYIIIKRNTRN